MTSQRIQSFDTASKKTLSFTFDGATMRGVEGDTIASALLANSVRLMGRSFKYHRPRGLWGYGVEEPNAMFDITDGARRLPNQRATTTLLKDGMVVETTHGMPNAAQDRYALLDHFARFIPSGFYYKTFMWPDWHLFEPKIREMAGLGRLNETETPTYGDNIRSQCDTLIVGAGAAGLVAALAASQDESASVTLVDENDQAGGSLLVDGGKIDGLPAKDWVAKTLITLKERGVRILLNTTAFGVYDHGMIGLVQKDVVTAKGWDKDRLWKMRTKRVIVAAGAIERPLVFANNDRPGVMSAKAARVYLEQYGILVGRTPVIVTNNDDSYFTALAMQTAGADVKLYDLREAPALAKDERFASLVHGISARIDDVQGQHEVEAAVINGGRVPCDSLLISSGFTPSVHLHCQAGGKLDWVAEKGAFVPRTFMGNMVVVGAANGVFAWKALIEEAHAAAGGDQASTPKVTSGIMACDIEPVWPEQGLKKRAWIDFQNDVTAKDIELAARENMRSVEHLKRYTTLGMATDQGKLSNLNGLALMGSATGRSIPEVGTTTYRLPYSPVSLAAFSASNRGQLMSPLRRSPLEEAHRKLGAVMSEYGGWLRPAHYGPEDKLQESLDREGLAARKGVALFDASSLGKIEVLGPGAADFLNFIYYNNMKSLKVGSVRYGFMLGESGVIYDDGVVARMAEDRYIVSCSSSHTPGVVAMLDNWRQDQFDKSQIHIHNCTAQWATIAVNGPKSAILLNRLMPDLDLSVETFAHMRVMETTYEDHPIRIARVSFTGERSYEVSVPAHRGLRLWDQLMEQGEDLGVTPIGVESNSVLRTEKGFIIIGKDTDGNSIPADLGMHGPLAKKKEDFIGRRALSLPENTKENRMELVGLTTTDGNEPLVVGAHAIALVDDKPQTKGYVTSSYYSANLGKPVALGLVENGSNRTGENIIVQHLGKRRTVKITPLCAYDPKGDKINA